MYISKTTVYGLLAIIIALAVLVAYQNITGEPLMIDCHAPSTHC